MPWKSGANYRRFAPAALVAGTDRMLDTLN